MEEKTTSVGEEKVGEQGKDTSILNNFTGSIAEKNPIAGKLGKDGSRIFLDYLEWLGFASDPDLIVISPIHHYYYDYEDLRGTKTVLNLKPLNNIKEIRELLLTINCMLSFNSFFVGSFIERDHQQRFLHFLPDFSSGVDPVENGITSKNPILNMIYNFLDSRTNNRNMTIKSVSMLLEEAGFKVLDMTEINGVTCFCSQKVTSSSGCE